LPATAWAILGLLAWENELSGYDLKKWADSTFRLYYWSPATSQIYLELQRLSDAGLVESRVIAQDSLRNKRMYKITPAGLTAITAWAKFSPVEPPVIKHGVMLRAWLGHIVGVTQLREIARQHQAYLTQLATDAEGLSVMATRQPEWRYAVVVDKWAARFYRMQAELIDDFLADLDEVEATERAGSMRVVPGRASAIPQTGDDHRDQ
jgi:DNA-binding PadR family transcriptional regulator